MLFLVLTDLTSFIAMLFLVLMDVAFFTAMLSLVVISIKVLSKLVFRGIEKVLLAGWLVGSITRSVFIENISCIIPSPFGSGHSSVLWSLGLSLTTQNTETSFLIL
jgi:hypothetical protein